MFGLWYIMQCLGFSVTRSRAVFRISLYLDLTTRSIIVFRSFSLVPSKFFFFKYLTILFGSIPQLAAIITLGVAWLIRAQSSRAANPEKYNAFHNNNYRYVLI